jgi:hypothetical protein
MGNQNGRPAGKAPSPEVIDKEILVVSLRRQGLTWDQISDQVGYSSPSSSRDAYLRASRRVIRDDIEDIRNLELDRLDVAMNGIWIGVQSGDTQSIVLMLKIMDRRAKLLALDAPRRLWVRDTTPLLSVDELDRKLGEILADYL